ncbi:MAG: DUF4860 domain-containing protein [Clostridiales bacterium]|nr:DUF4860 domain-containing protein [Clostridiales bacterium]
MDNTARSSHAISGVFIFLLLGVFAVFSTVMVVMGAKAYRSTIDRQDMHNADRIAPAYIRSMVRADDERGVLTVEEVDGMQSITMRNTYDEDTYITRIYCCDGKLYEWFSSDDIEFAPAEGEAVCACDGMEASLQDGLLSVKLLNDEVWTDVDIALRAFR